MKYECGLLVESLEQGETKILEKNLCHCHFVQHKSYVDYSRVIESGLPRWVSGDSFHILTVSFPLSRAVVVIPNCHSSADFTNFTPAGHKNWITGHCSWCLRISGASVWTGHIIATSQKKMSVNWVQVGRGEVFLMAISASFTSGEERKYKHCIYGIRSRADRCRNTSFVYSDWFVVLAICTRNLRQMKEEEVGRAYSTHWQEETRTGFWSGIFKDGYPSKALDVVARMIMK